MGLFPEDHKITVDDLLKLWMAEEFVLNSERENMEEASRNCLSDLLNRSLGMVSGMRINRDIVYRSLHDVVREFCLRKLTEDNYIQLKSSKSIRLSAATLWEMKKLRHVNINSFPVVWEDNDEGSSEECSTSMLENMKTFRNCDIRLDNNMNARLWWRFPNLEEVGLQVEDEPKFPLFPIPEVHTWLHSVSLKHLYLGGFFLTEEMVLNIARLKKLESLKLHVGFPYGRLRRFRSCSWDVTNVEFRALKYLTVDITRYDDERMESFRGILPCA
ncbi:hypothetical protein RDI58_015799 [Solanum bulbocastanum]|uniref:Disease resistance protein winged helix domain-containing protein n=1 Tax=Solanum bulbocastanum TaxID=147425 RepID=A0AAN8TG45_SOLBU